MSITELFGEAVERKQLKKKELFCALFEHLDNKNITEVLDVVLCCQGNRHEGRSVELCSTRGYRAKIFLMWGRFPRVGSLRV